MDASVQQFLNSNTNHNFLWLEVRNGVGRANHPAEDGIDFDVIVATCAYRRGKI